MFIPEDCGRRIMPGAGRCLESSGAYLLGRITFGGNPIRDYVYERSVKRYVPCAGAASVGAGLTALGLLVFFWEGGMGQGGALCFACCLFQLVVFFFKKKIKKKNERLRKYGRKSTVNLQIRLCEKAFLICFIPGRFCDVSQAFCLV